MLRPFHYAHYLLFFTLKIGLDRAIGHVSDPAEDLAACRLLSHRGPEEDPVDEPCDSQPDGGSAQSSDASKAVHLGFAAALR